MMIRANEIKQYMELHGVKSVPLEAVSLDIPALGYFKARKLTSNRVIVTKVYMTKSIGNDRVQVDVARLTYTDAEHLLFETPVPAAFEFNTIPAEAGQKMLNDLVEHNNSLESRFRKVVDQYTPTIQDKLAAAAGLIEEAEELADKHGLPFRPKYSITGFCMSYMPKTFKQMFSTVNSNLVYELTHASGNEYDGWQSSQTC